MGKTILATDITTRTYPLERLEIRAGDGDTPKIEGYASVFNRLSEPLDDGWGFSFREKVAPGAFARTLGVADVRALVNHDPNFVLGRNKSGTLTLAEDDHGLAVGIEPPDTSWANDLMVSMKRGDVNQMSFGFRVIKDKWESIKDQNQRQDTRTLLEVALYDVSVVTFPAYKDTSAAVRSILADAGIDLDALSVLVARAQRGLELASDDYAAVRSAIDILNAFLPKTASSETEPAPIAAPSELVARKDPARTGHSLAAYKLWLEKAEARMKT
jgi:HK97 family phage prohead protease